MSATSPKYDPAISVYIGVYRYISAYIQPLPTYIGAFAQVRPCYIGVYRYISVYIEPLPTYVGDFAQVRPCYIGVYRYISVHIGIYRTTANVCRRLRPSTTLLYRCISVYIGTYRHIYNHCQRMSAPSPKYDPAISVYIGVYRCISAYIGIYTTTANVYRRLRPSTTLLYRCKLQPLPTYIGDFAQVRPCYIGIHRYISTHTSVCMRWSGASSCWRMRPHTLAA
jgi:hypothetical protein